VTARYTAGCNWATATLSAGGRAYTFNLRHDSFTVSEHLQVGDFLRLLESVQLDPARAVD